MLCLYEVRSSNSNAEQFEEVAVPLLESLYNFARWLAQDREEAEDLVQETYVKGLKGFSSFRPGTNFRAWMFRILKNTFLTSKTGLAATATVAIDEEDEAQMPTTEATPESIAIQRSGRELLEDVLQELPLAYREVILLCDVEEMKYQEIAEALSIPIGTVMSRLSRARRAMRRALGERGVRSWSAAERGAR